ncbi:guanylate kinase [Candidatus Uhrbacteria bacterium]|nr:guanylate kinase [Candidatus Uhrbacteria bacterium]
MPYPLIIICGPSGVGKTVMIRRLLHDIPALQPTVTYTTRAQRKGAKAAEDKIMRFISPAEFRTRIRQRQFLEWALVHGHYYYGTPQKELERRRSRGPVILNIEVQGTQIVKRKIPDAHTIFILPTPRALYLRRLKKIRADDPNLAERIRDIHRELKQAPTFDYRIYNHEGKLQQTYRALKKQVKNIIDKN